MGLYINSLPDGQQLGSVNKADKILASIPGSIEIPAPTEFLENLVCVVDNGIFEAAGYAFCENEMRVFLTHDGRPKRWLIVPGVEHLAK